MSDIMIPMEFGELIHHILEEKKMYNRIFNVTAIHTHKGSETLTLAGKKLENPLGPSAGPHTQLAQNIVASYVGGSRFIELKTVQRMYGEELGIPRPCINSVDEGYNVEWSSEYSPQMAFDEYVKAWFALKVIATEFGLGDPNGFIFNMSVGYNLEGIKIASVDRFIEGLKEAKDTEIFKSCKQWLMDHLNLFENVTAGDVEAINSDLVNSISLSTMHGCPADEIESICEYLLTEKRLNIFLKCNPTLLGYDTCRSLLDQAGFDYIEFAKEQFEIDLGMDQAIPMLQRLKSLGEQEGLIFGVKLTNTFPVKIQNKELPGDTMYMSGKSLYPLTIYVAKALGDALDGKVMISYSGGVDDGNIKELFTIGIWPITVCTILLQGRGYDALKTLAEACESFNYEDISKTIDLPKLHKLADGLNEAVRYKKTEIKRKKYDAAPQFPSERSEAFTCRVVCGNCVRVCPNRANETLQLSDKKVIIHIDAPCNECGNCACACVEPCQPYKDRLTYFVGKEAMEASENDGFYHDNSRWGYRFRGSVGASECDTLPEELKEVVDSFARQYPFYIA